MSELLDITEDYTRDINMHYSGSVIVDTRSDEYYVLTSVEPSRNGLSLYVRDSKKRSHVIRTTTEEVSENFKAVCLDDGFTNLNTYCVYTERKIDGKYKKVTTTNNTTVQALGRTYVQVRNKRVKDYMDAYVCMKALRNLYYNFEAALDKLNKMFSVALSPRIAMVKQPVKEGEDRVHIVYYDVYIGEVVQGVIKFEDEDVKALVIDQLRELGYED